MNEQRAKRKLTAILSADVKGYSRLMADNEEATVVMINAYREVMTGLIKDHRGRVVDAKGDNVLAEFSSVVDAVRCAVQVQKELTDRNSELPEHRRMEFRIGINLGDVIEERGSIYGDGVNVAARLEGLAEGGGICISGTAFDQVKNRISVGYEYQGKRSVKNLPDPVRVYKVLLEPEAAGKVIGEDEPRSRKKRWAAIAAAVVLAVVAGGLFWNFYVRPDVEPASVEKMAYPLPDKPSIAVLPFDNLSGDPEQEYIADGTSENIISTLSKVSNMFVIARNSMFTYKGKPVKVRQVAEELGVRYVLEGSVQKSGDQLRVTAQIIDALTGHHLWSEKYDRNMKDFFDLQDEITKEIVVALQVEIGIGEQARIESKSTENFEAWTNVIKGSELNSKLNKEDNIRARALFETATKIDPGYAGAWTWLASSHQIAARNGWTDSRAASMKLALELAQKALALDDKDPFVHTALGDIYRVRRQYEKAITEFKIAISLDPNYASGYSRLGSAMLSIREFEEAITLKKKAMRLSPYYHWSYLIGLARSYCFSRRYEEAIAAFNQLLDRCRKGECPTWMALSGLAWVHVELERVEEARTLMAEALENNPKLSLAYYRSSFPMKDPDHLQRMLEALRKAGIPENPPLPLPDRPSIAVLPFVNMSGDPEQEYFSDGITEEIITALSKTPKLFVIARTSSFKYKGKEVDVRTVGRELGVKYVLEGSVRKAGDKVRVTSQLIDAQTNNHLWAERYDREMEDFFSIQDAITKKVVTSLQVMLTGGEEARIYSRGTNNLEAYLKLLKGLEQMNRWNNEGNALAQQTIKEVIFLDPNYGNAYYLLAVMHSRDAFSRSASKAQESIVKAMKLAQKAIALDESLAGAYGLLGWLYTLSGQHQMGIAQAEQAIALHPNSETYLWLGLTLNYSGRHEEAVAFFRKALRINPFPVTLVMDLSLATAYRDAERYEEVIPICRKILQQEPDFIFAHALLASSYALMGRLEAARAEASEVLRIAPKFSVNSQSKRMPYKNEAARNRARYSLLKAGLPE